MVLKSTGKSNIAMDFGSYEIKIVKGRQTTRGIEIDKYFSVPVTKDAYKDGHMIDEKEIYHFLNKAIEDSTKNSKEAYLTIKTSDAITRTVIFPNVPEKDMAGILKNHINDYIPMDPRKYIVQHKELEIFDEMNASKKRMLIIGIPKDIVESHLKLVQRLKLKPVLMDYQSNSISKLILYSEVINDRYRVSQSTIALVDIGYSNANVTILKKGVIQVTKIIKYMSEGISNDTLDFINILDSLSKDHNSADVQKRIIENFLEINVISGLEEVFRYYISQDQNNSIDMIFIYGGYSNLSGIEDIFFRNLNISTVKISKLDKVLSNFDINKYLNCIGALITN